MVSKVTGSTNSTTATGINEEQAKKLQEQQAKAERQKTIYQQALDNSTATDMTGVRKEVKAEIKKIYKETGDKAAYKQAKKDAGIGFWRRNFAFSKQSKVAKDYEAAALENKTALDDKSEEIYLSKKFENSGNLKAKDITEKRVRKDVMAQVKSDYKNRTGEFEGLSDAEAKKLYKNTKRMMKKGSALEQAGTYLGYVDGKQSRKDFAAQANRASREAREAELKGQTDGLSKDSKKTISKLGLSENVVSTLYEAGDKAFGTADGTFNYSFHKNGKGANAEPDQIRVALREAGAKTDNVSDKEIRKLYDDLCYHVEKPVETGELMGGITKGAGVGCAGLLAQQNQVVNGASVVEGSAKQSQIIAPFTIAAGAVIGGVANAEKQIHRVEDEITATKVEAKTLDEYAKKFEKSEDKKVMLGIAKHYVTNEETGEIDNEAMTKALEEAAGGNRLNHQEARGLWNQLLNGEKTAKFTPEETVVVPPVDEQNEEKPCELEDLDPIVDNTPIDDTSCYKVKKGDTWDELIKAKYQVSGDDVKAIRRKLKDAYYEANKEELNAKGIKSSYAAFFPLPGQTICLPNEINGHTYHEDKTVKTVEVGRDNSCKSFKTATNPFLQAHSETTYRVQDCHNRVFESTESPEKAREAARNAQKK